MDVHDDTGLESSRSSELQPTRPSTRSRIYLAIALVVAVAVAAGLIWYITHQEDSPVQSSTIPAVNKKTAPKVSDDQLLAKFIKPTTGETWYETRKPIAAQGWFKSEDIATYLTQGVSADKAEANRQENMPVYFEVGTRSGNTIIMVHSPPDMSGRVPMMFEKKPDGTVAYIARPQTITPELSATDRQSFKETFNATVAIDDTVHYDSLSIPSYFALDNGEKVTRTEYSQLGSIGAPAATDGVTRVKVADYGRNALYRVERTYTDTKLTNIGYELVTLLGATVSLDYAPNTLSLEKYSWENGQAAQGKDYSGKLVFDNAKPIARGCGGVVVAVTRADGLKSSDIVAIGKTDTGRVVYQPKDDANTLFKKSYDEYVQWQKTTDQPAVSFEQYKSAHGMIIIKNASDELLVYVREQYAPSYGCAKPVVYLYPTSTQSVDVRVGAHVVLSDPFYPEGGWRGVTARPDGQLSYGGRTYESLFWEGPGYGEYPGITSGTVVKRADAETTMRRQLKQQGLTDKEIADFMEFWTPRIPEKPYIRLSWLTTSQMNVLAPLYISPKPDTVIRVFLDMSGYDSRIVLPPQKLSSIPRSGFTVVEWGGVTQMTR